MSAKGIALFTDVLNLMREAAGKLLEGDNQDIRLGQLLDDAKDSVKGRFAAITMEEE